MILLIPLLSTLDGSPWLVVLITGTLAVAWFALLAAWLTLDRRDTWM